MQRRLLVCDIHNPATIPSVATAPTLGVAIAATHITAALGPAALPITLAAIRVVTFASRPVRRLVPSRVVHV